MKSVCCIILLFFGGVGFPVVAFAQAEGAEYELKLKIQRFEQQPDYIHDTGYINAVNDLAYIYSYTYPDSALLLLAGNAERSQISGYKEGEVQAYMITGDAYQTKGMYDKALSQFEQAYALAKDFNYETAFSRIDNRIGIIYLNEGNYVDALDKFYQSLKAAEALDNKDLTRSALNNIAIVNYYQEKYDEADTAYRQGLKIAEQMADTSSISLAYNGLGEVSLKQQKPERALQYLAIAYNLASKINDMEMKLTAELSMGEAYFELDSLQKATTIFEAALYLSKQMNYSTYVCNALIGLAKVRYKQGFLKDALANGLDALQKAQTMGQVQLMRDANEIVSSIYEALNDGTNALKYFKAYKINADSINSLASERAAAAEKARYEFSKKEIEFERKALQQRWITFSALAALLLVAIILWLINRNRKRLNLTNKELQKKNEVIEIQKLKAEETLFQLQAAQAQLIQSEKMASLGELTAGIAHEIQNPLNFVNNFSDINAELLNELQDERQKNTGERDDAVVNEIISDIKQNFEKIHHHGKRADAIVKGMLQHSKTSKGIKEPTDINKLADEYLRLAYHGLRAKDKSFNADFKTDFDESIGNVNVVLQDIGRVLLNLFNNAFYAVNEKQKVVRENYQPMVSISTKRIAPPLGNGGIEIRVEDNGNGIPQNIVDKIFQPFFTTKPTGQGTGLGLSLSYDIIKAHDGEIKVATKDGEGTTFIIQLPYNS